MISKMDKLLVTSMTLLVISSSVQARSVESDSKVIFSQSHNKLLFKDNLEPNHANLLECQNSVDPRQVNCNITGLPTDESKLRSCSVKFNAMFEDTVGLQFSAVYQFKNNKLFALLYETIPNPNDPTTETENLIPVMTIRIINEGCASMKSLSPFYREDGKLISLRKMVIYQDGFDVILNVGDKAYYHSYDDNGDKIGEHPVPENQVPNGLPMFSQEVDLGKSHSHGFVAESGYQFFPNGSIVKFVDDFFNYLAMRQYHRHVISDADDGRYHAVCILPTWYKESELECVQYDLVDRREVFQVNATDPDDMEVGNIENLSQGGFLLSLYGGSEMKVYVMRPGQQTIVDEVQLPKSAVGCRVQTFDEATGRVTVMHNDGVDVTRRHFVLQNYAAQL